MCNNVNVFTQLLIKGFYFNVAITVGPALTALTVLESDQMAVIQIMNFTSFPEDAAPFTITYMTTDGTATGMYIDYVLVQGQKKLGG